MKMNIKKTKSMAITRKQEGLKINLSVDGENIDQVKSFVYLGQKITEDGKNEEEIKKRIEQARKTFNSMREVLTARRLGMSTKLQLVNTFVWSVLLYGSETWTLTKALEQRLRAFELWVYRRITRTSWKDKITNVDILKKVKVKRRLMVVIKQRKVSYCGHIMRHDTLQKTLLEWKSKEREQGESKEQRGLTTSKSGWEQRMQNAARWQATEDDGGPWSSTSRMEKTPEEDSHLLLALLRGENFAIREEKGT